MKLEAGKFYRTRDGQKASVVRVTKRAFPVEGLIGDQLECWTEDGRYRFGMPGHPLDLVAEWTAQDQGRAEPAPSDSLDDCTTMYADVTLEPAEITPTPHGYGDLHDILQDAFDQSAHGKGKERHASDKPFDRQPIMEIGRMVGPGYAIGQLMKKAQEAMTMQSRHQFEAADRELLGAIVYAAAAVKLIRENRV